MRCTKKTPDRADGFDELMELVKDYGECCRADEMKGGGDPYDVPLIEAQLELARIKLEVHVARMRRGRE